MTRTSGAAERRPPARRRRRRSGAAAALGVVLATSAVAAGGCSSTGSAPSAGDTDAVLALGRELWTANCARCHGPAGLGGVGPRLADRVVERYPDPTAQAELIAGGKGGMPPFRRTLAPEEIEAVVRYTREVL